MITVSKKWIRLIGIVGCTVWMASCKQASDASGMKPSYATMKVEATDKELSTSYSATIRGRQDIDIYPQVSGTIEKLCVTEGQKVRRGQLLFIIDQVPYKAALKTAVANVEAARAALATAELTYNSNKELYAQKVVSEFSLKTAENIKRASILSMYSGADFIKTSTGKIYEGATLEAAYVMCQCIKEYYEKHGVMIGFKAAGGIRTTADAVKYYTVVKEVLGEKWLTNQYFRIGASSLANALFQSFTETEVSPF